jgi:transcriptional regulator with XRE-family HTH domain
VTKDSFGIRLQRALDSRDCKAIELHRKTGISRGAISSYLSGRWKVRIPILYKLRVTVKAFCKKAHNNRIFRMF